MTARLSAAPPATPRSFRDRILRAGTWSLAGFAITQAIRFGTNLIMTRLLVPEMFGVMSVAMMIMLGLTLLSDIGLRQSVVQHRLGNSPAFLDTVWVTKILVGFAIAGVAMLASLGIYSAARLDLFTPDSAYASPQLPWVVAALGLSAAILGFESTKGLQATRDLALGRITQLQLLTQAFSVAAMLFLAAFHRSVWVLVAGHIVGATVTALLSHVMLPGHSNRFARDKAAVREILKFGKWVLLSSVLGFFANAGDKIFLGGLLDVATLGVYSIAFMLMSTVENVLGKIIGDVSFPALSEVNRERRHALRSTLYKIYVPLASFNNFCAGLLISAAPAVVTFLYDSRYDEAGSMLQVLAFSLLAVPARVHAMCLLTLGHSKQHSHLVVIRLATLFIGLPIAFRLFGLTGALWAVVASYLSFLPGALAYAYFHGTLDVRKELLSIAPLIPGLLLGLLLAATLT